MKKIKMLYVSLVGFIFFFVLVPRAGAETLFYDDFSGSGDIERGVWTSPTGDAAFFGRTAIRNPDIPYWEREYLPGIIEVADGSARLRLDRYNPTDKADGSHDTFWGSEMDTRQEWAPSDGKAISFEASVRSANIPTGVVTSMFGYHLIDSEHRDELDSEFLSNWYNYHNQGSPQVLTNYFINESFASSGHPEPQGLNSNFNFADFNTFRIDWYTNKIQWYVNGALLASKDVTVPGPLGLRFNIWVPDSAFLSAYDGNLTAASSLGENSYSFYDVDWVKVSNTPEPVSMFLFGIGGLTMALLRKKKKSDSHKKA